MKLIKQNDALQAHPEYLNEQIDDHDKAIYAKGWNDCNKEYYNAITELPVASIDCTDLSTRLRRAFEADELVNQRLLLDAADAIEELLAKVPHWISVEERLPETAYRVLTCSGEYVTENMMCTTIDVEGKHLVWAFRDGLVTHWMPLPEPPKGVE